MFGLRSALLIGKQWFQVKGKKRKHSEVDISVRDCANQAASCPIVVENLDQPGHMLVEVNFILFFCVV